MTGKSNTGQADPTAEAAGYGPVWVGCSNFTVLPPSPLVFKIVPAAVFKGGHNLVDVRFQAPRSAARVDHWWWSMWQALRDFCRQSMSIPSSEPQSYSIQRTALHRARSWAGGDAPCRRRALPNVAASSVTWPLCWLSLPARGLQCWGHDEVTRSSGC